MLQIILTNCRFLLHSQFIQPSYVPTIEDEIEEKRQKLIESLGGKGTPVTPETFAAWQERKRLRRLEEAKKKVQAEMRKKKGGKGLSVLSGRDLYEYKKDLFSKVDEDENMADPEDDPDENDVNGGGPISKQSSTVSNGDVEKFADKVQSELFLQGDDEDLDDIEDD